MTENLKISPLNRALLLVTVILAGYQVAVGIEGMDQLPILAYTIAFGTLLVASLLIILLGYDALDSPLVIIISTIIPLSLSLGLVWQHLPELRLGYLVFTCVGFVLVLITRWLPFHLKIQTFVLAVMHGTAGLILFLLPTILAALGVTRMGYALVGLGGALMGLGGLLLSFLKAGKPLVSRETILRILPILLFLLTAAFVAGSALA